LSQDAISEASLTPKMRCRTLLGSLQRPRSPGWTKGKGKDMQLVQRPVPLSRSWHCRCYLMCNTAVYTR